MTLRILSAAALMSLLAGCASSPSVPPVASTAGARQAVSQGKDKDVVCVQEHTTGSHLAQVVCTTREEREAAQRGSAQALQNMQRGGPRNSSLPNTPPAR
ncbi:MAG TPA: hypothetical protein VFL54_06090 [Gammaproteobacteria bacterium]|jgi:hypothetical protein|nr:hypothetical protein [Gammaproteobacteria bacterium]